MSFVGKPFEHDIFVTYSHGSVVGCDTHIRQWSQALACELEKDLRAHYDLAATLDVFLDDNHRPGQGIDPTEPLTPYIKQQVESSAILVVIMSDWYIKSRWCTDERNWWYNAQIKLPTELSVGIAGRCFVCRMQPTSESWPEILSDYAGEQHKGFAFHPPAEHQPFLWPGVNNQSRASGCPTADKFNDALKLLAGHLRNRLLATRAALKEADRVRIQRPSGQKLYLFGRDEHDVQFQKIRHALAGSYDVNPLTPQSTEKNNSVQDYLQRQRIKELLRSDALLLLGTEDTQALNRDFNALIDFERREVEANLGHDLRCCIIDTAQVAHNDPSFPEKAKAQRVDWFDATTPAWISEVGVWLQTEVPHDPNG